MVPRAPLVCDGWNASGWEMIAPSAIEPDPITPGRAYEVNVKNAHGPAFCKRPVKTN
jgi:hypothetical protein